MRLDRNQRKANLRRLWQTFGPFIRRAYQSDDDVAMLPDQTLAFGLGVVVRDNCQMLKRGQAVEYDSADHHREGDIWC